MSTKPMQVDNTAPNDPYDAVRQRMDNLVAAVDAVFEAYERASNGGRAAETDRERHLRLMLTLRLPLTVVTDRFLGRYDLLDHPRCATESYLNGIVNFLGDFLANAIQKAPTIGRELSRKAAIKFAEQVVALDTPSESFRAH